MRRLNLATPQGILLRFHHSLYDPSAFVRDIHYQYRRFHLYKSFDPHCLKASIPFKGPNQFFMPNIREKKKMPNVCFGVHKPSPRCFSRSWSWDSSDHIWGIYCWSAGLVCGFIHLVQNSDNLKKRPKLSHRQRVPRWHLQWIRIGRRQDRKHNWAILSLRCHNIYANKAPSNKYAAQTSSDSKLPAKMWFPYTNEAQDNSTAGDKKKDKHEIFWQNFAIFKKMTHWQTITMCCRNMGTKNWSRVIVEQYGFLRWRKEKEQEIFVEPHA